MLFYQKKWAKRLLILLLLNDVMFYLQSIWIVPTYSNGLEVETFSMHFLCIETYQQINFGNRTQRSSTRYWWEYSCRCILLRCVIWNSMRSRDFLALFTSIYWPYEIGLSRIDCVSNAIIIRYGLYEPANCFCRFFLFKL